MVCFTRVLDDDDDWGIAESFEDASKSARTIIRCEGFRKEVAMGREEVNWMRKQ